MKRIVSIFVVVIVIIILSIFISKKLFHKKVTEEINMLMKNRNTAQTKIFHFHDLVGLPEPVQRYFKYALKDGQEYITSVQLKQVGEFRMKEDQPWMPIKAEQYFTTEEPSFLWWVQLKMNPLIWIEGRDIYYQGKGNMLIKLLSTLTVADAKGDKLDVSSLLRFLSEAVWVPTALLPSDYLEWVEIDSNSAKVIIRDENYSASGIFTFNEKGEIIKFVTHDRYREVAGEYFNDMWTCYYGDYREFNGIKIPMEGEVEWNLSDRNLQYAKLKIDNIRYNVYSTY